MPAASGLPSPEEALAAALKGVAACHSEQERAKIEDELRGTREMRAMAPAASPLIGSLDQRITDLEELSARLRKKGGSSALSRHLAIQQARDQFIAESSRKRDVANKGRAAASVRTAERHEQLVALQEQLRQFAAEMEVVERKVSRAHAQRDTLRDDLFNAVVSLFDQRLADAEQEVVAERRQQSASQAAAAPAAAAATAGVPPAAAPADAVAPAAGAGAAAAFLDADGDALLDVSAHVLDLEAQLGHFRKLAAQQVAFEESVAAPLDAANAELPSVTDDAVVAQSLEAMHLFLQRWKDDGSRVPFTLGDLGVACAVEEPVALFVAALGDVVTTLLPGGMEPTTVVTRQAATYAAEVVARLAESFPQPPTAKAKATEAFELVVAKRRKRG